MATTAGTANLGLAARTIVLEEALEGGLTLEPEAEGAPEAPELTPETEPDPVATAEGSTAGALGVGPDAAPVSKMLPETGPGTAVALAPTPLKFGMGAPGVVVPLRAMAACWKAEKDVLPVAAALIDLSKKPLLPSTQAQCITSHSPNHTVRTVRKRGQLTTIKPDC
jgi:hypothetical protein